MRLAVLPSMTLLSVGDSEFAGFWSWLEAVQSHEMFAYLFLPKQMQKIFEDAGIKQLPKVAIVYEDEPMQFYVAQMETPVTFLSMFSPLVGKYAVDAVLTSRTPAAGVLSRLLWDPRYRKDLVPIVVEESMAVDYGITSQEVSDQELIGRSLGYLVGWPVFHSDFELKLAMSAAGRFLRPSSVAQVLKRAAVVPRYLECDKIDGVIKGVKKNEQFTLFVGQRLNETKGAEDLLDVYDKFFAAGRPIRVVATSPRAEAFTIEKWRLGKRGGAKVMPTVYPEVEFKTNCLQEEFWRTGAAAHAYLNMSKVEGFPIGFVEQLYCGPVGVFGDVAWVRGVLGEEIMKNWPYVFRSTDEAALMVRRVYENYEEAAKWVEWLRPKLRERFGKGGVVEQLYAHVERAVASVGDEWRISVNAKALIDEAMAGMPEMFTLGDLYAGVCKASKWYREGHTRGGQMSKWWLYKWLATNGFRDLCDDFEPRYKK